MSTTGEAPVTVMLSATLPGLISTLTVAVKPMLDADAFARDRPEPGSSKVSL